MAFDPVLTGATANDGTGDPLRTAFTRINDNFDLAVEGAASSTDGTVVQFDGTTGKVVKASSVAVADIIVEGDARLTDSRTPTAHGNEAHTSTFVDAAGAAAAAPVQSVNTLTGAVVLDAAAVGADPTGTAASEVSTHNSDTTSVHGIANTATLVVGPATATSGRVAVYADGTGKLLQDGAKLEADIVAGPASATADAIALYDGTTGKIIKDSTVKLEDLVASSFTWTNGGGTSPAATTPGGLTDYVRRNLYDKMKGCVLNADGTVNYYLNPTNWAEKETGGASVLTGADGNVMVEIPKFYYRVTRNGNQTTWAVATQALTGFTVHPAFIKDGVEVSHRYYGAYDACLKFSRSITAVADAGGGDITVTVSAQHPLYAGDSVTIAGTTSYNGTFTVVSRPSGTTFTVTAAFVATETGTASGFASGKNLNDFSANTPGASNDLLASVKGIYPLVGLTRAEFRARANNLNTGGVTGWRQLDWILHQAISLLYVIEYQTFNNQTVLGVGNTNGTYIAVSAIQNDSPHTIAGAGDAWANGSTDGSQPSAGAKPGTAYVKYRGIENPFGNAVLVVDGINTNVTANGTVHVSNNAANWADNTTTNYTLITSSAPMTSGVIQTLLPIQPYFLAATTGGTTAQYVTDQHEGATGTRGAVVGGRVNSGLNAGLFLLSMATFTARSETFGARLAR